MSEIQKKRQGCMNASGVSLCTEAVTLALQKVVSKHSNLLNLGALLMGPGVPFSASLVILGCLLIPKTSDFPYLLFKISRHQCQLYRSETSIQLRKLWFWCKILMVLKPIDDCLTMGHSMEPRVVPTSRDVFLIRICLVAIVWYWTSALWAAVTKEWPF